MITVCTDFFERQLWRTQPETADGVQPLARDCLDNTIDQRQPRIVFGTSNVLLRQQFVDLLASQNGNRAPSVHDIVFRGLHPGQQTFQRITIHG
ncbi:hypothetical protein [Pseudomonas amygdali]|uniref:hypothetical protein n=1 Tax=Pseudomonas amygdali TaxID=47877 RepID=UPI0015858D83|nr:hypothetical protein [Pseudomonas amygdali]